MGFYVSQLRSVPIEGFEYFVYFVDASREKVHGGQIAGLLFQAARKPNEGAPIVSMAIVDGTPELSEQVSGFLQKHVLSDDFSRLYELFNAASCLIISEGPLQTTTTPLLVLPLVCGDTDVFSRQPTLEGVFCISPEKVLEAFFVKLIDAMRQHRITDFCRGLGVEEIQLREIRQGMLVATLRRLNEVLDLKPNFVGLGLNLNAVIDKFVGPRQRDIPE